MSRVTLAFLSLTVTLPIMADEPRPVKILARGPWPHLPTHVPFHDDRDLKQRVLRSDEELGRAAGAGAPVTLPKALKVDAIDFGKQMLLIIEDGTQPLVGVSGGGPPSCLLAVAVVKLERDAAGKTLTVHWQRFPRRPEHGIITRPLEAVLVERFAGAVKFARLPDAKEDVKPAAGGGVIARAFFPDGWRPESPRQEWVVRNYDDLIDRRLAAPEHVLERMRREAAARYAKALKVESIDFEKQMVIGVSGGVQPIGARVEVTRVERDGDGALTVFWRLHQLPADRKPDGIAHVAEVILVERATGDVRFREEK